MPEASALGAALERIQAGSHTATDVEVLRRAYLAGQITIASGQRAVAIGGNAEGAVIVTGDGPVTVQGASADALRQLVADITDEFKTHDRSRLDPQERQNRRRMLARVRRTWITGFLEDSLHGAALQALGLEELPEAVPDRWSMVVQQPDRPSQMLPPDTSVVQVFDEVDGELLILGDPGSGKTTLLLELTRALLDRAEQDEALPMPIVFPLAPWAAKQLPLADWLIDELSQRYDVPRSIGQRWVSDDQILPLLDGLDEVAAEHRTACVAAINAYRENRAKALPGLVVTSRIADYDALTTQLQLRGAVLLQPLRAEQIDAYLASAGEQLAGVRKALEADATLRELAASPLLLSMMSLAYQRVPAEALPASGDIQERRTQLFATYVDRMFTRRAMTTYYSRQQTLHWLKWLATTLSHQAQTIFYLERLQPEWLPTPALRRWYTLIDRLENGLLFGLAFSLYIGPLWGLLFGLVFGSFFEPLVGYIFEPLFGSAGGRTGLGLLSDVAAGRTGGMASPTIGPRQIIVVETLRWSGRRALSSAGFGLSIGLLLGLFWFLFLSRSQSTVLSVLFGSLLFGLFAGLAGGLTRHEVETKVTPNQGIRRSARTAILAGLSSGLFIGLFSLLVPSPLSGLFLGLLGGLLFGLFFGGFACLSHLALRLVLWRIGALPLATVHFLDYATERVFVRKVGGGYTFVHRLLQDYFAALKNDTNGQTPVGPKPAA